MALTPVKKKMVKDMAIGAVALAVVLMMPTIGAKISDAIASVRGKIGG